jgi:phosphatidylinositol alpha-mannosyltransferase
MFHTTLPEVGRKPGGVEKAVHRLANALVTTSGHSVTVFSLSPAPDDARYDSKNIFPAAPFLKRARGGRLLLPPALLNTVDFRGFDVIHLHGDDWFFVRRQHPSVRTLHGSALREAQAATGLPRRLLHLSAYPLERISVKLATISVAVSRDTASIYGVTDIIGMGVDTNVFYPGEKVAQPQVLFVGTWEGRKRGRWMYRVFLEEILPAHPDSRLCMITDYCPPHPSITAEQFPSDAVLSQRYRESWIFASPSTYEGFGIPYVEALASGTAVVATPNGGATEILDDGRYGVLAADQNFGAAVNALLGDAAQRGELERTGRSRAAEYSWESAAEKYTRVYKRALEYRSTKALLTPLA